MSNRVVIVVDNPKRDLPGVVLVAAYLCQHGVTCHLVPHNLVFRNGGAEFLSLRPDFVLLNYLRLGHESAARQMVNTGIPFGILETEGGVLDSLDNFGKVMTDDKSLLEYASCYCSWGRIVGDYLVRNGFFKEQQVLITGAPRFDFYAQVWREAALGYSDYTVTNSKPMILINSNFSLSNPCFQTPEQEVDMYVESFGFERDFMLRWYETEQRTLKGLVDLANRLAARFPDMDFVYRPHPFESLETYVTLIDNADNLSIRKEGTVDSWILRAKAVIQIGCTTAIEAGFAGVPALQPDWLPLFNSMPAAEAASVRIENETEIFDCIQAILQGTFERPDSVQEALEEVTNDWFYRVDGYAHKRVADCILRNLSDNGRSDRYKKCRKAYLRRNRVSRDNKITIKRRAFNFAVSCRNTLRKGVLALDKRNNETPEYLRKWDQSEKSFNAAQVRAIADSIQSNAKQAEWSLPLKRVCVETAQTRGDYHFGFTLGRSVTIYPE